MISWLPDFGSVEECCKYGAFTDGMTQQAGMEYMTVEDDGLMEIDEWMRRSCW